ncbi:MAG TPA: VWA domain-containing protein [Pyrinomonadaceae bacterium]|nr:VWA domain-containing protein [Pyrinomonadaceae bacterium]
MRPYRPKTRRAAGLLLCLLFALAATRPAPSQTSAPPPQPPAGRAVNVTLTAVDKQGKFVTTLKAEDLRVEEDGAERAVTALERRDALPLLLAFGIDNSASQERVLDAVKMAAAELVKSVMRPGTDYAAVFSFTNEATLEQGLTADTARVLGAVSKIRVETAAGYVAGVLVGRTPPQTAVGATALWDAVFAVSEDLMADSSEPGRRAIILISDGVDTTSRMKPEEAIKSALRAGAAVYAIGIGDDEYGGVDRDALRKLAERTGGRAFFPEKVKELPAVFARLREELTSQYALTFTSPKAKPGAFRKIKIKVVGAEARGRGVEVSYPFGHFAGHSPKD